MFSRQTHVAIWNFHDAQYICTSSVWSWGWGVHGQLGLRSVEEKLVPTHASLLDECNVTLISAGYGHSTVLTADVRLNMNLCMHVYMYVCILPIYMYICVMYVCTCTCNLFHNHRHILIFLLHGFLHDWTMYQGKVLTFGNG